MNRVFGKKEQCEKEWGLSVLLFLCCALRLVFIVCYTLCDWLRPIDENTKLFKEIADVTFVWSDGSRILTRMYWSELISLSLKTYKYKWNLKSHYTIEESFAVAFMWQKWMLKVNRGCKHRFSKPVKIVIDNFRVRD